MNQTSKTPDPHNAAPPWPGETRVAVVSALWHADIVAHARESLIDELARHELSPQRVECFDVPGSFEIPLKAQQLARSGRYRAVVGIGLVVDGGIYRHDFVAAAVVNGLMRVGLDTGVPVLSVSLTPHHFQPSEHHVGVFSAHFVEKGREAAQAALMITRQRAALAA